MTSERIPSTLGLTQWDPGEAQVVAWVEREDYAKSGYQGIQRYLKCTEEKRFLIFDVPRSIPNRVTSAIVPMSTQEASERARANTLDNDHTASAFDFEHCSVILMETLAQRFRDQGPAALEVSSCNDKRGSDLSRPGRRNQ